MNNTWEKKFKKKREQKIKVKRGIIANITLRFDQTIK